jgi:anti-sigma regulatory factor (Ser/Thr protein kinase)
MPHRLTVTLGRSTSAPHRARCEFARFGHGLGGERRRDAELLLTELVSNAVKYGEGADFDVSFERNGGRFRAEVVDQGRGFSLATDRLDPHTPGGWGLHLVERLADRWGRYRLSSRVWFELALE